MGFSEQMINAVWSKGHVIPNNNNPDVWRQDIYGSLIKRNEYGNTQEFEYGWEIDHINPNGDDSLSNLQPLHWKNNRVKGNRTL